MGTNKILDEKTTFRRIKVILAYKIVFENEKYPIFDSSSSLAPESYQKFF